MNENREMVWPQEMVLFSKKISIDIRTLNSIMKGI